MSSSLQDLLQLNMYNVDYKIRYEAALERKSKILDIIRTLDLPNNPLDDIIDQVGGLYP